LLDQVYPINAAPHFTTFLPVILSVKFCKTHTKIIEAFVQHLRSRRIYSLQEQVWDIVPRQVDIFLFFSDLCPLVNANKLDNGLSGDSKVGSGQIRSECLMAFYYVSAQNNHNNNHFIWKVLYIRKYFHSEAHKIHCNIYKFKVFIISYTCT